MNTTKENNTPLSIDEIDVLLTSLYRLYNTTGDTTVYRISKSLFSLLTQQRFSTNDNLPTIDIE